MKMLKRAGAFAIAGAMALSLGTVSTFAASPITVGDITYSELVDAENVGTGVYQIKVPFTVAEGTTMDQATLLAEVGTKDVTVDGTFADTLDASTTTVYIDQEANDGEFVIYADASRFVADATNKNIYLNVKIGGTGVSEAAIGSEVMDTYVNEDPFAGVETAIASEVKGALTQDAGSVVTDVYNLSGASIMRLDIGKYLTDIDLSKHVVLIDGVEAAYTQYNFGTSDEPNVITKLVAMVPTNKVDDDGNEVAREISVETKEGGSTQILYGDMSGDVDLGAIDLSQMLLYMLTDPSANGYSDYQAVKADVSGEGKLGALDLSQLLVLQLDTTGTVLPNAASK